MTKFSHCIDNTCAQISRNLYIATMQQHGHSNKNLQHIYIVLNHKMVEKVSGSWWCYRFFLLCPCYCIVAMYKIRLISAQVLRVVSVIGGFSLLVCPLERESTVPKYHYVQQLYSRHEIDGKNMQKHKTAHNNLFKLTYYTSLLIGTWLN